MCTFRCPIPLPSLLRSLYSQLGHAKARESNPDCKLEAQVREDSDPPWVRVEYLSGEKQTIDATGKTLADLFRSIQARAREMDTARFLKDSDLLKSGKGLFARRGEFASVAKKDSNA